MEDSRVRQGGLMRCCLASIAEDQGPDTEGRVIECNYHREKEPTAIFHDGAWQWVGVKN